MRFEKCGAKVYIFFCSDKFFCNFFIIRLKKNVFYLENIPKAADCFYKSAASVFDCVVK